MYAIYQLSFMPVFSQDARRMPAILVRDAQMAFLSQFAYEQSDSFGLIRKPGGPRGVSFQLILGDCVLAVLIRGLCLARANGRVSQGQVPR